MYWNLPYPFGIADIRVEDFIDLDECGVFVETADKHYGKAYVGNRVRQEGNYQKSEKWTLLLAVAGSVVAERWQMMWLEGGTTGDKMIEFIEMILNTIGRVLLLATGVLPWTICRKYRAVVSFSVVHSIGFQIHGL